MKLIFWEELTTFSEEQWLKMSQPKPCKEPYPECNTKHIELLPNLYKPDCYRCRHCRHSWFTK